MTNEEARRLFSNIGLSYQLITKEDIKTLSSFIKKELKNHTNHVMTIKSGRPRKNSILINSNGLVYAEIRVDSVFWKDREGITFNRDGFIGFAGWADSKNVKPFIVAFEKWVNKLRDKS